MNAKEIADAFMSNNAESEYPPNGKFTMDQSLSVEAARAIINDLKMLPVASKHPDASKFEIYSADLSDVGGRSSATTVIEIATGKVWFSILEMNKG